MAVALDTSLDEKDRRRWDRYPVEGTSAMTLIADGRPYECFVQDISVGGVKIKLGEDAPKTGRFELRHPAAGSFWGARVWQSDNCMGVRFDLPEASRAHILKCLSLLLNPQPAGLQAAGA